MMCSRYIRSGRSNTAVNAHKRWLYNYKLITFFEIVFKIYHFYNSKHSLSWNEKKRHLLFMASLMLCRTTAELKRVVSFISKTVFILMAIKKKKFVPFNRENSNEILVFLHPCKQSLAIHKRIVVGEGVSHRWHCSLLP